MSRITMSSAGGWRIFLALMVLAPVAALRAQGTAGVTVGGAVFDSVARAPLSGAVVQLVADAGAARFSRSTFSDSLGRFAIAGVPVGRFTIGFIHPRLDTLAIEPPLRVVIVDGTESVRIDLAIPSPGRLRAAICASAGDDSQGGVIMGVLRDARNGTPVAGGTLNVEWLEVSIGRSGVAGGLQQRAATSSENGWFALCGVPRPGTIAVTGHRGPDSTDRVEIELSADGLTRRELYLGPVSMVSPPDTTLPPRRAGDGQLRGVVVTVDGRPIRGAQVGITNGPSTTANNRGEWTLNGAPNGTRLLQVRAFGYYPEREPVDVIDGSTRIRTTMSTMKAILDTVRITASRLTPEARDFEERRRGAGGRYLTQEDVVRRQPLVTSDLFRTVPGLGVERAGNPIDGTQVLMRGMVGDRCSPAIYLNGIYMSDLGAEEIDTWVKPGEVAGIEIYTGPWVPVQFTTGMAGIGRSGSLCGSIVIWTRTPPGRLRRTSWKERALTILGAGGFALMIGILVDRF